MLEFRAAGREIRNPKIEVRSKSEIRNPKSERSPKSETRNSSARYRVLVPFAVRFRANPSGGSRPCAFRVSGFGLLSDFGHRVSVLSSFRGLEARGDRLEACPTFARRSWRRLWWELKSWPIPTACGTTVETPRFVGRSEAGPCTPAGRLAPWRRPASDGF